MRAIQVTCPKCGGALRVGGSSDEITCEYCGAVAVVQRRSPVLQRTLPVAVRVDAAERPLPIAVQRRNVAVLAGVITLALTIGLIGVAIWLYTQVSRDHGGTESWQGTGAALLADVNRDGTLDVIGRSRQLGGPDTCAVIALDGRNGKRLWKSEDLGTYDGTYQGVLSLAGDAILYSSPQGVLTAYSVTTGARRWSMTLVERTKAFCGLTDGAVIAVGTDGVQRPLRLADGRPEPEAAVPASCPPLPDDGDQGDPGTRRSGSDHDLARRIGHDSSAELITSRSGARVLVATRPKGTRTPQLIALGEHDDVVRWTMDVPADPLAAEERASEHVAIDDQAVCALYKLTGSKARPRLVCFDLADGRRRWDVELSHEMPLEGVQLTPSMVVVSTWNLIEAFDPTSGKRLWRFGVVR